MFCSFFAAPRFRQTLVVGMDFHDDHAHRGAAPKRQERCLRAFLRHEKLALAMRMATVSYHSWHGAGRADAGTQTVTLQVLPDSQRQHQQTSMWRPDM